MERCARRRGEAIGRLGPGNGQSSAGALPGAAAGLDPRPGLGYKRRVSGWLPLLSWTAGALCRSPAAWLVLGGLWGWWILGSVLGPIGLASASAPHAAPFYELAFLSATAGATLTLGVRRRASWLLDRAEAAHRARLELAMLAFGGGLGLLAGLAPTGLAGSAHPASWGRFLGGGALGLLHLAALGRLVAALRLPASLEPALFLALAWAVPAAVAGPELLGRAIDGTFDVARSWRSPEAIDLLRTAAATLTLTLAEGLISAQARTAAADTR